MSAAVWFRDIDIVFGKGSPKRALALLDQGRTRDDILTETGQVVGVAGANLTVEAGEICVLMGLSGSGKSTLLRSVNRLNVASRGDVLVDIRGRSVNVSTCGATALRDLRGRSVAMVFQQFALLPWRTVRDNVGFGLELRGLGAAERHRIVDEKLAMVGLDRWSDKYAHELSGGMQQRVGLARAFATDADILLMDEPFSALDPLIRTKLQDELLALQSQLRKTILFVSHDLDEAIKLGNRIVIMEGGRIVQAGTAQDVVMRPADDYVREFVRHMNPLEALQASSVMTPWDAQSSQGRAGTAGATSELDGVSNEELATPCSASPPHPARSTLPKEGGPAIDARAVTVPATMPLRQAIALRHRHNRPLLVVDDAGVLLGTIGEAEIYRALLRG